MRLILTIMLLIPLQMFAGDLVLHLKFEEASGTLVDQSGYGNNGTVYGATYHASGAPNRGYGMSFDGTNDYVDCGTNASLNITNAITIEVWVNPVDYGGGGYGRIVDKMFDQAPTLWLDSSKPAIGFQCNNVKSEYSNYNILSFNVWQHIVVVYTSNTSGAFYFNGINAGNIDNIGAIGTNAENLRIGNSVGENRCFNGTIDEVKIYNYALSPAQILHSYNQSGYRRNQQ